MGDKVLSLWGGWGGPAGDLPSTLASLYLAGGGVLLRNRKPWLHGKRGNWETQNLEVQGLVLRDRYTCTGWGDCSDHLERPLAVGTSETAPLGDDLCGSGAGRLLVQVSMYTTMWLKRKAPHLSVTHNTQSFPHTATSKADGGDKMTSLLALGWASSG